jgi:hypothetical protein
VAKKPTTKTAARPGDKRAQARERVAAARAAEARRERKARILFRSALGVVGAAVVGGIAWAVVANGGSDEVKASGALPEPVAYGSTTALPPWAAPANASTGAQAAGLKVSAMEGTANHFHAHVDVIVDGKAVPVPADLGIDQAAQAMSELHTHDATGVVHIEAPAHRRYVLGQVFNEWGIRLDAQRLGGLETGDGKTLAAYVDGKKVSGNPAAIELTAHREIALVYGDKGSVSVKVPSSYDFPSGE